MTTATTDRQLIANRQNALKSSGPQTLEGKAVAKLNALRHGILAKEVVIRGENIQESSREFRAVLSWFWQDLAPTGAVEEMLVERIATCYWRLRRVLIAEAGEVKLAVDAASWRRLMQRCDHVVEMKQMKFAHNLLSAPRGCRIAPRVSWHAGRLRVECEGVSRVGGEGG